ncbi:MAG: hypothetical protein JO322_03025 [Candidatus Eremiobacteraeota bacterium]|nr:hypothetical protein [Candidatus Eremiobacteraeota bacterium]
MLAVLCIVAACSGRGVNGGSSSTLPSTPQLQQGAAARIAAATTPQPTPTPIVLGQGQQDGEPGQFKPATGDSSAGGTGKPVDGIPCGNMYDGSPSDRTYHVHAFLGVMLNGKHVAIPPTIGMVQPGPTSSPGFYSSAKCFYQIHTHDASGYIHMESPSLTSKTPYSDSLFTLGNVLHVWGQPLTSSGFANFAGPVHVFYATTNLGNTHGGAYNQYTGTSPQSIPIYSHEAIWIEVGTFVPASQLPRVIFFTQY